MKFRFINRLLPERLKIKETQPAEMGRLKSESEEEKVEEGSYDIYGHLGEVEPFTVLAGGQFNSFIAGLNNEKDLLTEDEKGAFNSLWYAAAIDFDGNGNNIWNLKEGSFEILNANGIFLGYEKKPATEVENIYSTDSSRANFIYSSDDGGFAIIQHERNKDIFMVYITTKVSPRLLDILHGAEARALNINKPVRVSEQKKEMIGQAEDTEEQVAHQK